MSDLFPSRPKSKPKLFDELTGLEVSRDEVPATPPAKSSVPIPPQVTPTQSDVPGIPTPDQAADRKLLQNITKPEPAEAEEEEIPGAPTPREVKYDPQGLVQKKLVEINSRMTPDSPELKKVLSPYSDAIARANDEIKKLREEKGNQLQKAEWMQLGEKLGNALMAYAAGAYGAKHGVDMSGTKFSQTDWQKQLENRLALLDNDIQGLRESRNVAERGAEKELGRQEGLAKTELGLTEEQVRREHSGKQKQADQEFQAARDSRNAKISEIKDRRNFLQQLDLMGKKTESSAAKEEEKRGYKEGQAAEKATASQEQAKREATNILLDMKAGKGNKKQLEAKLDQVLARAGETRDSIGMIVPGMLWGENIDIDAAVANLQSGAAKQTLEASAQVRMKSPDGAEYNIDRAELEDALKNGWTEVK